MMKTRRRDPQIERCTRTMAAMKCSIDNSLDRRTESPSPSLFLFYFVSRSTVIPLPETASLSRRFRTGGFSQ
ncbi:hypothetical protein AB1N83_008190 [Pleurotus pulmonarius]